MAPQTLYSIWAILISFVQLLSPICINTATLSSLNLLTLPLTSSLVCKPDHIQNSIFHALINSRSMYCFINTILVLKYNIPTNQTSPVELKLFNRLPNNIISKTTFLSITFPSSDQIILNMYITSLDFFCSLVLRYNWLTQHNLIIY